MNSVTNLPVTEGKKIYYEVKRIKSEGLAGLLDFSRSIPGLVKALHEEGHNIIYNPCYVLKNGFKPEDAQQYEYVCNINGLVNQLKIIECVPPLTEEEIKIIGQANYSIREISQEEYTQIQEIHKEIMRNYNKAYDEIMRKRR